MAGIDSKWHDAAPRRWAIGSLNASVVPNTTKLNVSFDITNYRARKYSGEWMITGSGSYGSFNDSVVDRAYITVDGQSGEICASSPDAWSTGNRSTPDSRHLSSSGTTNELGAGNRTVHLYIHCGASTCDLPNHTAELGSFTITIPNPYSPPSITINSVSKIIKPRK